MYWPRALSFATRVLEYRAMPGMQRATTCMPIGGADLACQLACRPVPILLIELPSKLIDPHKLIAQELLLPQNCHAIDPLINLSLTSSGLLYIITQINPKDPNKKSTRSCQCQVRRRQQSHWPEMLGVGPRLEVACGQPGLL